MLQTKIKNNTTGIILTPWLDRCDQQAIQPLSYCVVPYDIITLNRGGRHLKALECLMNSGAITISYITDMLVESVEAKEKVKPVEVVSKSPALKVEESDETDIERLKKLKVVKLNEDGLESDLPPITLVGSAKEAADDASKPAEEFKMGENKAETPAVTEVEAEEVKVETPVISEVKTAEVKTRRRK